MTQEPRRIDMKKIKLSLILVLVAALAILVLQNRDPWQVRFLWISGYLPGIILIFLTTASGFVAGIFAALLMKGGNSKKQDAIE